jgi:hypothetical protein
MEHLEPHTFSGDLLDSGEKRVEQMCECLFCRRVDKDTSDGNASREL